MKSQKGQLLFAIVCLVGVVILAFVGFGEFKSLQYPEVQATVYDLDVEVNYGSDLDYEYEYTALVSYTIDGQAYKSTIPGDEDCQVGDVLTVRYNPHNKLSLYNSDTGTFIALSISAAVLLVLGIGLLIGYAKTAKVVKENAKPDASLPDNLQFK